MSNNSHDSFDSKFNSYTIGFGLSIVLTVGAFMLAISNLLTRNQKILALLLLAVIQLFVQLVFFLHLNKEHNPRWNTMMFILAALFVVILVFGSIWIMNNLDYNMSPKEAADSLLEDEGLGNN